MSGGVAGINTKNGIYTGRVYGTENANGAVSGSVTAANYAGGVAGTNRAEITRVENYARCAPAQNMRAVLRA